MATMSMINAMRRAKENESPKTTPVPDGAVGAEVGARVGWFVGEDVGVFVG